MKWLPLSGRFARCTGRLASARLIFLVAAATLLLTIPITRASADLLAGAARVDITPDVKASRIPLGGYAARRGAPAVGVHDPVYAHALVLTSDRTRIAIVSLDLCFLPANVKTETLKKLRAAAPEWSGDQLFLSATHTHSGPDPLAMHAGNTFKLKGWTPFDALLLDFTTGKIASAILQAQRALHPATVSAASVDAPELNRNRRGENTTDPALTLVKFAGRDGKAIAGIVNYAAHPTLYGDEMMEVSADWPGVMAADVEAALGAGSVCLFLNGAEGDASPAGVDTEKGADKVTTYGHRIAARCVALLGALKPESAARFAVRSIPVSLPPHKPTGMYAAAVAQLGGTFDQAKALVDALMPVKTSITTVRIGRLLLIGIPCEPTADLGLRLKAEARAAGYPEPKIVALTNDWLAYALMPDQYRKGNYEAMMSFYGDQLGPTLISAFRVGIKRPP